MVSNAQATPFPKENITNSTARDVVRCNQGDITESIEVTLLQNFGEPIKLRESNLY